MRSALGSLLLVSLAGCCACGEDLPAPEVAPVTSWAQVSGPAPEGALRVVSYNVKLLPVIDADDEAPRATLILLAAPAATAYHPRVGFSPHPSAWVLREGERLVGP